MLRRILASSRYLIIIAVLATFLAAVALLIYGSLTVLHVIYAMVVSSQFTTTEAKHISVEFIEIIDLFLLSPVLYIVSLGLYELFIDERIVMPRWLVITDLDDLKGKLLGVITVLLAVTFLGDVVTWDGSESILWLGLATGLVLLALGYLLGRSIKPHQSEEPTRSTSEKEQE